MLPDWLIEQHVKIEPFSPAQKRLGLISYGLSSYGYDARVGYRFGIFSPVGCQIVDPKAFDPKLLVEYDVTPGQKVHSSNNESCPLNDPETFLHPACRGLDCTCLVLKENIPDHILIPPNSFALAETLETFEIPRDVLAICVGKSSYARCGIVVNVTPLEPEWKGRVTVEISNTTPLPAKIYAGEGIMQIIFLRTDGVGDALLNAVRRLCGQDAQDFGRIFGFASIESWFGRIEEHLHADLGLSTCRKSYADKAGKYQGQTGLTPPLVD